MNTDALELPSVSTTIETAKAALLPPEWWLTNSIDKVTLKALWQSMKGELEVLQAPLPVAFMSLLRKKSGSALASSPALFM